MTTASSLKEVLVELGLGLHEAQVYLAMLHLGPTSVLKISKAAQVKRTTIYSILDSLQQRGLVRIEQKGFKRYFVVEAPEKLEVILDRRKKLLQETLPEFQAIHNLGTSDSLIKYYHGITAVKSVYSELLALVKPGDDYLIISNPQLWHNQAPDFFDDFLERRSKLPIKVRALFQESNWGSNRKRLALDTNQQTKFLPSKTHLITNLVVIPSRVVVHQLVPPIMAIVIENKSIVQLHRQSFEIMWSAL